jgi:hypothetical protein
VFRNKSRPCCLLGNINASRDEILSHIPHEGALTTIGKANVESLKLLKGSRSPPRVSRESFAALESRHHTHDHHSGHYGATKWRPKRKLGIVEEPIRDQQTCDTEGKNPNAVYADNADLDSENAIYDSINPYNLTTSIQVLKILASQIVLRSPFLQRRS